MDNNDKSDLLIIIAHASFFSILSRCDMFDKNKLMLW